MRINSHALWILALATMLTALVAPQPVRAQSTKPTVEKIDIKQFERKRTDSDTVVLDVRTPHEYTAGHVPGAVNLDIHDPKFTEKLEALDKSKTYLVHCAMGVRSEAAARKMTALGFPHLFDFHGGFKAWQNAHKPIEKGDGKAPDSAK